MAELHLGPRPGPRRRSRSAQGPMPTSGGSTGQDLILSGVFLAAGPLLLLSSHALNGPEVAVGLLHGARAGAVGPGGLHGGIQDLEIMLGLFATAGGLALCAAAAVAVAAAFALALIGQARRRAVGAVGLTAQARLRAGTPQGPSGQLGTAERLLRRCSPRFLRSAAAVLIGAQGALLGMGAATAADAPGADPHVGQISALLPTTSAPEDGSQQEGAEQKEGGMQEASGGQERATSPSHSSEGLSALFAESPSDPSTAADGPEGGALETIRTAHQEAEVSPLFTPTPPPPPQSPHGGQDQRPETGDVHHVTVRAGDTLWQIVADHLGPGVTDWEVAAEWPRWHEANRGALGEDPDRILPGTVLAVPAPSD